MQDTLSKFRRAVDEGRWMNEWDKMNEIKFSLVQFVFNNRFHFILNTSPFALMFGKNFLSYKDQSKVSLVEFRDL